MRSFFLLVLVTVSLFAARWLGGTGELSAQAPRTGISSPSERDRVFGPVPVLGTAVIGDFVRYELEYRPEGLGDEAYTFIESGERQVIDGLLGTWQTGELAAGLYALRLRAVRSDSNYTESVIHNIIVDPTLRPTATAVYHPPKQGGSPSLATTLSVQGIGRVNAEAEQVIADFYPDPLGGSERFDALTSALIAAGISADNIQTDRLARGEVGTLGRVRVIDDRPELVESLLDQIIAGLSTQTPLVDVVVRFALDSCEVEAAQAARDALVAAESEAELLASALGVELAELVQVERIEPADGILAGCFDGSGRGVTLEVDPANGTTIEIVVVLEATYRVRGAFSTELLTPTPTPTADVAEVTETPTPDPLVTATETPTVDPFLTPTSTPTVDIFATPTQTPNTSIVATATATASPTVSTGSPVETPTTP